MHPRHRLFGPPDGVCQQRGGTGGVGGRHQTQIHPQFAAVRHHIGAVAALDLPEGHGGHAQLLMGRRILDDPAQLAHHLRHGRDGICPLPWRAGVGGGALHGDLKPGAALVGHLNLPVGRLRIQHPVPRCDPAIPDDGLRPAHEVLLIHRPDEFQRPRPGRLRRLFKRGKAAGQPGFHIAGSPAITAALPLHRGEGRQRPALPHHHSVHVADEHQRRQQWVGARQFGHQVGPPRQHFAAAERHAGQCRQPALHKVRQCPLILTGIGAVDLHQFFRQFYGSGSHEMPLS